MSGIIDLRDRIAASLKARVSGFRTVETHEDGQLTEDDIGKRLNYRSPACVVAWIGSEPIEIGSNIRWKVDCDFAAMVMVEKNDRARIADRLATAVVTAVINNDWGTPLVGDPTNIRMVPYNNPQLAASQISMIVVLWRQLVQVRVDEDLLKPDTPEPQTPLEEIRVGIGATEDMDDAVFVGGIPDNT